MYYPPAYQIRKDEISKDRKQRKKKTAQHYLQIKQYNLQKALKLKKALEIQRKETEANKKRMEFKLKNKQL